MVLKTFVILKILQMVFSFPDPGSNSTTTKNISNAIEDEKLLKACNTKGGHVISKQCIIFSEDAASWKDSNQRCLEKYGPLLSPADPKTLHNYTANNYNDVQFWVGGHKLPSKTSFEWLDGSEISPDPRKFPWGQDEPTNPPNYADGQGCMMVNSNGYAALYDGCSEKRRYVCSRGVLELFETVTCISISGDCFIFSNDLASFQVANERCDLKSPADPQALIDYVAEHYTDVQFWVGGYRLPSKTYFEWRWGGEISSDHQKFPWAQDEPYIPPVWTIYGQGCMMVNSDGYAAIYTGCSDQRRYVCSIDACGLAGGSTVGHQCLAFKEDFKATWNESIDLCEIDGGKLLVPAYPRYLADHLRSYNYSSIYWVGGVKSDPDKPDSSIYSVGGVKSDPDKPDKDSWYWLNGEHMTHSDVFRGVNRLNYGESHRCLSVTTSYWNSDCAERNSFICELGISSTEPSEPVKFLIRHSSSGQYVGPNTIFPFIDDGDTITLNSRNDPNMHMAFDIVDKEWGYIRHIKSGKIISPKGGHISPGEYTRLILHSHRRPWALFALDQFQNRIIHRSGKSVRIKSLDSTDILDGIMTGDVYISEDESRNETTEFQFMNPSNSKKEVLPYGYATVSGDWVVVFSVLNPLATHTYSSIVTTGKSKTHSTSHDFKYGFEVEEKSQASFTDSVGYESGREVGHERGHERGHEVGHEVSVEESAKVGVEAGFEGFGAEEKVSVEVKSESSATSSSSSSLLESSKLSLLSSSLSSSSSVRGGSNEHGRTNSLEHELQESSAGTWKSEESREISFTVNAGQSVAVWQRVFIAEKHGHKSVHLSNLFADTNSSRVKPNNFNGDQHSRIV